MQRFFNYTFSAFGVFLLSYFFPLSVLAGSILSLDNPSSERVYEVGKPILVSGKYDLSRWDAGGCTGGFFILTKVDGVALPSFNTFPGTDGLFAYFIKDAIPPGDHTIDLLVSRADKDGVCKGETYTISHVLVAASTTAITQEHATSSVEVSTTTKDINVSDNHVSYRNNTSFLVAPSLPTVVLETDNQKIPYGAPALLRWRSTGAFNCDAHGDWEGVLPRSGVLESKKLFADALFTLVCRGEGGVSSSTVAVTVAKEPLSITLFAQPPIVSYGGNTTVVWHTEGNVTSCAAQGEAWGGAKKESGHEVLKGLTEDTTLLLMCKNNDGVARQVSLVVPVSAPSAPTLSFELQEGLLSWQAKEARGCTASGAWEGERGLSGTTTTSNLKEGALYVLTCSGDGGKVARSISVGKTGEAPTVMLSTPYPLIKEGATAKVSWEIGGGALCKGSGDWEGQVNQNGSLKVGPVYEKRVYTLTCENEVGLVATSLVLMPTTLSYLPSSTHTLSKEQYNVSPLLAEVAEAPLIKRLKSFLFKNKQ